MYIYAIYWVYRYQIYTQRCAVGRHACAIATDIAFSCFESMQASHLHVHARCRRSCMHDIFSTHTHGIFGLSRFSRIITIFTGGIQFWRPSSFIRTNSLLTDYDLFDSTLRSKFRVIGPQRHERHHGLALFS